MPSKRHRDTDCLHDIIDNIARIEAYIEGLDQINLEQDGLRHDAVERCLERVCEAAVRLGDQASVLLPAQPWADIRGMATGCVIPTTRSMSASFGTWSRNACQA